MHRLFNSLPSAVGVFIAVAVLASSNMALANNGTANNGTANNNNNTGGNTAAAGVEIDPQGVLRILQADPRVTMARLHAARQGLPPNLARPSKMRKVSLNRLEAAVAKSLAEGESLSTEMITLAGMFFYPESGDIVLAGPAEGFGQDAVGRLVGVNSGHPCLLLDDLIVALRAFSPTGDKANTISVSIDPTQEGLARMQQTLQQLGGTFNQRNIPLIVNSLRESLGLNDVTIKGIPAGTHFAHVLTEADYRMKLIGIGLEAPPVPMSTYVSRLTTAMTSTNALVRWYFVPDYEAIATSEDRHAMKMVGQGLKLVGEDELVGQDGTRKSSGRGANRASQAFTTDFTKKFRLISEVNPVYSQLRNLVDMSIAAAFIQQQDFYGTSGWDLGVFSSEDGLAVETLPAPRQVETAINAVMKGSRLITPIGGGVTIQARKALDAENVTADTTGEIGKLREQTSLEGLDDSQWWWD